MNVLEGLAPELAWAHFLDLTRIPRPPKHEGEARAHVLVWATAHGFASSTDVAGNVVVRIPATRGCERSPTVVLQAHLDMVCERDPDSPYDARAGRIHVVRDGDWIRAEGTTLGADNGIGVATALAVAEDDTIDHGPLELLFTVCEEEGLVGAKELDPALVQGRRLVNLDGTSDEAITVGCAGSAHTHVRLQLGLVPVAKGSRVLVIRVSGARGGHSGADIARGRANAIEALGAVLRAAYAHGPCRLVRLDGGGSRNAIPREASALVVVPDARVDAVRASAEDELARLRAAHAEADDALELAIEETESSAAADERATAVALDLLDRIPTGVVAMSKDVPDAVETSTSLNVAATENAVLSLSSMTRSADATRLEEVVAEIERAARRADAQVEVQRSYPPWRPKLGSPLLTAARRAYGGLFGHDPALEVVHGGLECAVLSSKLPGVQMIALGPTILDPHAPGERVSIRSTERFYRLLGALLGELSLEPV